MINKMKLRNFFQDRYFVLPALTALLLALSRYPIKLNFLVFIGFIPLLYLTQDRVIIPTKKVIKAASSFSTVYSLVALHWIAVVTVPGMFGVFILFGFYFSILFWVIFRINYVLHRLRYLSFICFWLSFEWIQNYGELRFPWFNVGYALADYIYLIQIAEYGGIYLLSFMVLLVNVLIFYSIRHLTAKKSVFTIAVIIAIFALWISSGAYRYRTLPMEQQEAKVSIVQVSIPQYIKWSKSFFDSTLALYRHYSLIAAESSPDLILWPEAAIPNSVLHSHSDMTFVRNIVRQTGADIFLGLPHYEVVTTESGRNILNYNAATVFNRDGIISPPYFKNILVPVGERIPFMDYISILKKIDFGQANWEYGDELAFYTLKSNDTVLTYSPLICFEIAFPDFIRKIADQSPDFIVNVTNDAWFKKTVGPYQHGMMTVIRAVETRTQFFRAANTGISMIVDPRGKITKKTALFEKTVIDDYVYVHPHKTTYVQRGQIFPLFFLIITFCLTIILIFNFFSRKRA